MASPWQPPRQAASQRQRRVVSAPAPQPRLPVEFRGGWVNGRPGADACGLDQQVLPGLLGEQDLVHSDRLGIVLLVNQHAG
jgi:hypothetical protein